MLLPSRDDGGKAAHWRAGAGILFLLLAFTPHLIASTDSATNASATAVPASPSEGAGAPAEETLLLEVQINGHPTGLIGEFILSHGLLSARPEELRNLGFKVPQSHPWEPGALIPLSYLPGLEYTLDLKNQVLRVTVVDSLLMPTLLLPVGREGAEDHRVIESGTGATLNYDIVNRFASGQTGANGSLDFRVFAPWGVTSSDWLASAGASSGSTGANRAIRLDSAYSFADANSLRRYSIGDYITSGLSWTRPVRMEGAQIRSDFSMRPDLITFPMPSAAGSAAVPSTVSVLADGNLMVSSQVNPGPFQTPQLPVVSGAGTISMTVTNALGQQVTVTQSFYASSELLAPGLKTFAGQVGLVRLNWGEASDQYGKLAGAALYRRGLTRKFTIEGSAEGTQGMFMAGAGGVAQIGNLGVLNFAAAASAGSTDPGVQLSAGAQRIGRVFSIGASAIVADSNYRDVASMNGDGVPRKQLSGFTSVFLRRFGSAGLAYAGVDMDTPPAPAQLNTATAEHSHVISANYSLQFHHASIFANEFKDLSGTSNTNGLQVGLTIPFGRRSSVAVSGASDGTAQVQVQKSAAEIGDWGYEGYLSTGSSSHEFGEVQYKSPVGLFTAGVDDTAGLTTLQTESQAAISFVDGRLFPSNTIYDSFAVVDTSTIPHVRVLQENRNVGTTNSSGKLLVPDMRSFDLNHISIDATDIPADVTLDNPSRQLRPQDRSGVVIRFPIKFSHGALLRLVDAAGLPIPLGSTARLQATGVAVPIGYDGDAYVEDLGPQNQLLVERTDGQHCTVSFRYRPVAREIPSIGPLKCVVQKP